MSRTAVIRDYLQAGKSVCPFAKACPVELVTTVAAQPRADRAGILHGVAAFATAHDNALVVVAKADKDFTTTAAWAAETFLELMICCTQVSHPTLAIATIARYVERDVRPTLSSREIRPHLVLHGKALMTICMAPIYPTSHPRHAPHTILVSTWSDDVTARLGSTPVPKIRETMAAQHGYLYDANELVLPLPTDVQCDNNERGRGIKS